jgi:leucyl-tRNA synthetase
MVDRYTPQEIEPRWQARWAESGLYATVEDTGKAKWYFLTMLPYPSGELHIGHWYAMAPSDTAARYRRMQGYNVFFPIGFDAFGLPAKMPRSNVTFTRRSGPMPTSNACANSCAAWARCGRGTGRP